MKKVLALIVTYNRLDCLKECIKAIQNQTYTDYDILVVNNGSSDGTKVYLDGQENVLKIHQENLGGAGGFYAGMKYMFDNGYEWLWMMDDDGLPASNQLEELLKASKSIPQKPLVLGSVVINAANHDDFSFSVDEFYKTMLKTEPFVQNYIFPFNGIIIKRIAIEKVGMIKKEMFIWGDEEEYMSRLRTNGIVPYTVCTAIHYHPKEKGVNIRVFPFTSKYMILDKPPKFSPYYYRNKAYIMKTYSRINRRFVPFRVIAFLWRFRWNEIYKVIKFFKRGLEGDFSPIN